MDSCGKAVTFIDDSISLSSSFGDVIIGMLQTGSYKSFLSCLKKKTKKQRGNKLKEINAKTNICCCSPFQTLQPCSQTLWCKGKALRCHRNHTALPWSATQKYSWEISYSQKATVIEILGRRWMSLAIARTLSSSHIWFKWVYYSTLFWRKG